MIQQHEEINDETVVDEVIGDETTTLDPWWIHDIDDEDQMVFVVIVIAVAAKSLFDGDVVWMVKR